MYISVLIRHHYSLLTAETKCLPWMKGIYDGQNASQAFPSPCENHSNKMNYIRLYIIFLYIKPTRQNVLVWIVQHGKSMQLDKLTSLYVTKCFMSTVSAIFSYMTSEISP